MPKNLKAKVAAGVGLLAVLLNTVALPLLNGGTPDYTTALTAVVAVLGALLHPSPVETK